MSLKQINLETMTSLFRAHPFIVAAYQFGSTIRGRAGPLSDLDIAILVDEKQAPRGTDLLRFELLLAHELQSRLRVRGVDLLTLNRQRLPMQHAVLRTGRLIYEAAPEHRIRFTRKVIREYLDFQPTLELIGRFHTEGQLRRCGIR